MEKEGKDIESSVRKRELDLICKAISYVGHEIRNSLTPIGGFIRRLARSPNLSEAEKRRAAVVVREVQRLEEILNYLRQISKPAPSRLVRENVIALLDDILILIEDNLNYHRIKVAREHDHPEQLLYIDVEQMSIVFMNIIKNAVESMTDGGLLSVSTREEPPYLAVVVRDTGEAIPDEEVEKLFDPFFSKKIAGSGLGLPISRKIVQAHGGRLVLDRTAPTGTAVKILLPLEHCGIREKTEN